MAWINNIGDEYNAEANRKDYALHVKVRNAGGKCKDCGESKTEAGVVRCKLKRNKVVNGLAVCHHFKEVNYAKAAIC